MNDLNEYFPTAAPYAERLIDEALRREFAVSVNDGIDWTLSKSTDRAQILDAMGTTGEDRIRIWEKVEGVYKGVGTFYLIYENGADLFADFTDCTIMCELANVSLQEDVFT